MSLVDDSSIESMPQEAALAILDKIHAAIKDDYYFSADAEFDDMRDPWEKLGKLLTKAFCPGRYAEFSSMTEFGEDDDDWDDAVIQPFRDRYGFC